MMKYLRAAVRGVRNEILYSSNDEGALNTPTTASVAGQSVNAKTAMKISTAFDCIRKTSETMASLPLAQYEKQPDGSRVKIDDDLSEILCHQPNSLQTKVEFIEAIVAQICLRGNFYAERLEIGPKKRLVGLRPIFNVTPKRLSNGKFEFSFLDRGKMEKMPKEKVFHVPGFGAGDGFGMSVISYGATSLGSTLAADETAGSVFSNQMMAGGVLTADQTLSDKQRLQMGEMLNAFVGSKRAGKTMILEAGLKHSQLQMNPDDAQLLETRRFNVEDVCRWFGVPPIIVGHSSEGQTMWGSGVEAIMISWLRLGINPLANRIEERIKRELIAPEKRKRRYFEFNREAMIQMDSKAKSDFLMKMRFAGIMTGDEGRDKLNMPRRGGESDELFIQSSMTPIELLGKDDQK